MGIFDGNAGVPRVLYGNSAAQLASRTDKEVRVFSTDGYFGGTSEDPDIQSAQALAFLREDLKSAVTSLGVRIQDTYVSKQLYNATGGTRIEGVKYKIDGAGWYSRWDSSLNKWFRVMGGEDPVIDDYYRSLWEQDAFCIRWDGNDPEGGITYGGRPDALQAFYKWVESAPQPCEYTYDSNTRLYTVYSTNTMPTNQNYPHTIATDVRVTSDTVVRLKIIVYNPGASGLSRNILFANDRIEDDGHCFRIQAISGPSDFSLTYTIDGRTITKTLSYNTAYYLEFGNFYIKNVDSGTVYVSDTPFEPWTSELSYVLGTGRTTYSTIFGIGFYNNYIKFIRDDKLVGDFVAADKSLVNRITGTVMKSAYSFNQASGTAYPEYVGIDASYLPGYHTLSKADLTKLDYQTYKNYDTSTYYLVTDTSVLPRDAVSKPYTYSYQKLPYKLVNQSIGSYGISLNNLPPNIIFNFYGSICGSWGSNCTATLDVRDLHGIKGVCTTAGTCTARIRGIGLASQSPQTGPYIIWCQVRTSRTVSVTLELTDIAFDTKTVTAGVWTDFFTAGTASNSTYSSGSSGDAAGFIDVVWTGQVGDVVEVRNIMMINRNGKWTDISKEIPALLNSYCSVAKRLPFFWDGNGWFSGSMTETACALSSYGCEWNEHRPYVWALTVARAKHADESVTTLNSAGPNRWRKSPNNKGSNPSDPSYFYDSTSVSGISATCLIRRDVTGPVKSGATGDALEITVGSAYTGTNGWAVFQKTFTNQVQGKPYIFSAYVRADVDDVPFCMVFGDSVTSHKRVKYDKVGRKWKRVQIRMMTPQADEGDPSVNASYRFTKPREQYWASEVNYTIEFGLWKTGSLGAIGSTNTSRLVAGCDYTEDFSGVSVPKCTIFICGLMFEECVGGTPTPYRDCDFYAYSNHQENLKYYITGPTVAAEFGVDQLRFTDRAVCLRWEWQTAPRSPKRNGGFAARGRTFSYDPSWTAVEYIETDGTAELETGLKGEFGDRVEIDCMLTNMGAVNRPNLLRVTNTLSAFGGTAPSNWRTASVSDPAGLTLPARSIQAIKYGEAPESYLEKCFRWDNHGILWNTQTSGSYTKSSSSNSGAQQMVTLSANANTLCAVGDTVIIEFDWTLTNWTGTTSSNEYMQFGFSSGYSPIGHQVSQETPMLFVDANTRGAGTYRAEMKVTQRILDNMASSGFYFWIVGSATGTFAWSNVRIWKANAVHSGVTNASMDIAQDSVPLTSGSDYVLSCWARADADPGETMAVCLQYGTNNASADGAAYPRVSFPVTREWKRYWMRFTAGTSTTNIYIGTPGATSYSGSTNIKETCMSPYMSFSGKGVLYVAGPKLELYDAAFRQKWGKDSYPGKWIPHASDTQTTSQTRSATQTDYHYIIGWENTEADRFGIYQNNSGQVILDYFKGASGNSENRYASKIYWPAMLRGERVKLVAGYNPTADRAFLYKKESDWDPATSDIRSWPAGSVITASDPVGGAYGPVKAITQSTYKIGDTRGGKYGYHSYRIYGVRVFRGDRLVMDLMPVKDRLGGGAGFIDRARNKVISSMSTALGAGPVVNIEYDPAAGCLPKISGTTKVYNTIYGQSNYPDTAVWRRHSDDDVPPLNERDWNVAHDMAYAWANGSGDRAPVAPEDRFDVVSVNSVNQFPWIQGVRIPNLYFGWYPGKDGKHEIWISGGGMNPNRTSWLPGMMPWFARWDNDFGSFVPDGKSVVLTRYASPFRKLPSYMNINGMLSAGTLSGTGLQALPDRHRQQFNMLDDDWTTMNEHNGVMTGRGDTYPSARLVPKMNDWEYTALGWIWTAYWGTPDISTGLCDPNTADGMSSYRWRAGQTDGKAQSVIDSRASNVFWKNRAWNRFTGNEVWQTRSEMNGNGIGVLGPSEWQRYRDENTGGLAHAYGDSGSPFVFMWLENPAGGMLKVLNAEYSVQNGNIIRHDYDNASMTSGFAHDSSCIYAGGMSSVLSDSADTAHFRITDIDMWGRPLKMEKGSERSRFGHFTISRTPSVDPKWMYSTQEYSLLKYAGICMSSGHYYNDATRVDLGIVPNDANWRFCGEFEIPTTWTDSYQALIRAYNAEANNSYRIIRNNTAANTLIANANTKAGGGGTVINQLSFVTNKKYKFELKYESFTVNGVRTALGTTAGTALTGTMKIESGRWYWLDAWHNGKLVAAFRPCLRKSDNKIGFVDILTGTMYFPGSTAITDYGSYANVTNYEFWSDCMVAAGGYAGPMSSGQCSFFDRLFGVKRTSCNPNLSYIGRASVAVMDGAGDWREI